MSHTAHAANPMAEPPSSIFVRVECFVRRRRPYLVTSKAEGSDSVWRMAFDLSGAATAGSSTRWNTPVRRFANLLPASREKGLWIWAAADANFGANFMSVIE